MPQNSDGVKPRSDWRTIDSAPRDGSSILVAKRVEGFGWVIGWAFYETLIHNGADISGWIAHGFFEPHGNLGLANPTHWQPLPEPPRSEDG